MAVETLAVEEIIINKLTLEILVVTLEEILAATQVETQVVVAEQLAVTQAAVEQQVVTLEATQVETQAVVAEQQVVTLEEELEGVNRTIQTTTIITLL